MVASKIDVLNADDDDGGCCVDVIVLACDAYDDIPLTDGERGISGVPNDAVELPYNKFTKLKLCADKLEDSSASFIATDVCFNCGVFDRFACNTLKYRKEILKGPVKICSNQLGHLWSKCELSSIVREHTEAVSLAVWHILISSGFVIGDDRFMLSLSLTPLGDGVSKFSLGSSASFDVLPELPTALISTLFEADDDDGVTTAIGFFFMDKFNGSLYSMSTQAKLNPKLSIILFLCAFSPLSLSLNFPTPSDFCLDSTEHTGCKSFYFTMIKHYLFVVLTSI